MLKNPDIRKFTCDFICVAAKSCDFATELLNG